MWLRWLETGNVNFNLHYETCLKFNIVGIKINEMVGGVIINTDHKDKKLQQLCKFFNADFICLPDISIDHQTEIENKINAINDKKHIDASLKNHRKKYQNWLKKL